jgi:penicillin amidase
MYKSNGEGEYAVYSSPALRILLDFADIENSESINPTGQSGNVMSPHYKDQTIMFNEGIYRPQLMNRETIDAESKTLILKSKKK